MFDTIKKLTSCFGVSGDEEEIREIIIKDIKNFVDDIKIDTMGNLIAIKKGKGKKIMLAAHMDEIGLVITHIDKNGFLRFSNLGGISPYRAIGQRIRTKNGTYGVVYYEDKLESMSKLKFSRMYIDIGCSSKEEAEKSINIGDTAMFIGEPILQNEMIISKALDDRIGCAILVEIIKDMPKTNNEIYFAFTVQEEIGCRGAKTVAFDLMPDIAIAVDVTITGDTPECEVMEVSRGKGPAIKLKDRSIICHKEVKDLLINTAVKNNIKHQYEILEYGGTDVGAIHLTAGGIPSGALSIPCRYVHSVVETVNINDAKDAVKLLKGCLV